MDTTLTESAPEQQKYFLLKLYFTLKNVLFTSFRYVVTDPLDGLRTNICNLH